MQMPYFCKKDFNPVDYPIYFAPLQGYTDAPYRNFFHTCFGGVDAYYTPFVRLEKENRFRNRDIRDITPSQNFVPSLIPQAIASDPDELRSILRLFVENGYTNADLNLGCPFPLLAKRHKGSGILPFTDEIEALFKVFADFPSLTFSVKMRLGWKDTGDAFRLLPLLEKYPIARVVLHPRLGIQQYKGECDLKTFTRFYEQCPVPLIYNGDLKTLEDVQTIVAGYPRLAGIMLGRGLLADPALAMACKSGEKIPGNEFLDRLSRLHAALLQYYLSHYQGGEHQVLTKMKTLWEYLCPDIDRKLRKNILKSHNLETYRNNVQEVLQNYPAY